jgi:hypothetical protein
VSGIVRLCCERGDPIRMPVVPAESTIKISPVKWTPGFGQSGAHKKCKKTQSKINVRLRVGAGVFGQGGIPVGAFLCSGSQVSWGWWGSLRCLTCTELAGHPPHGLGWDRDTRPSALWPFAGWKGYPRPLGLCMSLRYERGKKLEWRYKRADVGLLRASFTDTYPLLGSAVTR